MRLYFGESDGDGNDDGDQRLSTIVMVVIMVVTIEASGRLYRVVA